MHEIWCKSNILMLCTLTQVFSVIILQTGHCSEVTPSSLFFSGLSSLILCPLLRQNRCKRAVKENALSCLNPDNLLGSCRSQVRGPVAPPSPRAPCRCSRCCIPKVLTKAREAEAVILCSSCSQSNGSLSNTRFCPITFYSHWVACDVCVCEARR